jgi:hypothetical protein
VKTASMGITYADIELICSDDVALHRRGYISEDQIKSLKVRALVDSEASLLVIPESIKNQLNLLKVDEQEAELADGNVITLEVSDKPYQDSSFPNTRIKPVGAGSPKALKGADRLNKPALTHNKAPEVLTKNQSALRQRKKRDDC